MNVYSITYNNKLYIVGAVSKQEALITIGINTNIPHNDNNYTVKLLLSTYYYNKNTDEPKIITKQNLFKEYQPKFID